MSKKDKAKKKAKKEKESSRSDVKRMKNSIVPKVFADFVEQMEDLGESNHKDTVTTFRNDDVGIFVTIPKQGSTEDKISLFLNKSRGWEPDGEYGALEIDTWHTGDVRVAVSDSPKAMKQAYKICKEWMKSKDEHTPEPVEKKAKSKKDKKSKKSKKAKGNGEEKEAKSKKKKKKKKARAEAEA